MSNNNFRPGDWMCPACQNHNFARNQACRKCNGPRVDGQGSMPPMQMNMRQQGPPMNSMGPPMHMGGGGGIPANFRPGDWMCPACNNHNFARNNSCRSCYAPKQGGPSGGFNQGYQQQGGYNDNRGGNYRSGGGGGGSTWRAGDWQCNCGSHNFASRTNCRDCGIAQAEGAVEGAGPPAGQQGGNFNNRGGSGNTSSNWKPGDWKCDSCDYHNFARGITCRQCNAPKPEGSEETSAAAATPAADEE